MSNLCFCMHAKEKKSNYIKILLSYIAQGLICNAEVVLDKLVREFHRWKIHGHLKNPRSLYSLQNLLVNFMLKTPEINKKW